MTAGLAWLGGALPAAADDLRPLYVEINEQEGRRYVVRIKPPPRVSPDNAPLVVVPDACRAAQAVRLGVWFDCVEPLHGATLRFRYPRQEVPNSTVVKVTLITGESRTMALSSGVRTFIMPGPEDIASIAAQYTWLGVEHIWIGFDHLLFLVCLIWIAGTWRRIVVTITGFTLAHSVTLALSALEIVRPPVPPIEAVIALSVLFLATEVTKGPRIDGLNTNDPKTKNSRESLTWRYPIAVSSSFGLLHGLGFAAVLSEIGLPKVEVMTGLIFFNLGVEIGQVLFALGVILLLRIVAAMARELMLERGRILAGYAVGSLAAYWLIDRLAGYA